MARKLVAVLVALACYTSVGAAQEKATELTVGVLGLSYTTCSGCDGAFLASTSPGIGGGSVGVGFYVSPGMSIEPTLSFSSLSSGGSTLTIIGIGAAVPVYFAKGWGRKGTYFAPRFTYNSFSGGGASASQVGLGASIGTKVPVNDMAAFRVQANFDYGFEGDLAATTAFGALLGISVFFK